jgi:hypothetical protein
MSKAVKTKVIYDSTAGEASGSHFTKGGSLRSSGRIRRRIVLGEKFDYGEKAKEKQEQPKKVVIVSSGAKSLKDLLG